MGSKNVQASEAHKRKKEVILRFSLWFLREGDQTKLVVEGNTKNTGIVKVHFSPCYGVLKSFRI
jgi:hypothetical protein